MVLKVEQAHTWEDQRPPRPFEDLCGAKKKRREEIVSE